MPSLWRLAVGAIKRVLLIVMVVMAFTVCFKPAVIGLPDSFSIVQVILLVLIGLLARAVIIVRPRGK